MDVKDREESGMDPRFLACTIRCMEVPFTDMDGTNYRDLVLIYCVLISITKFSEFLSHLISLHLTMLKYQTHLVFLLTHRDSFSGFIYPKTPSLALCYVLQCIFPG